MDLTILKNESNEKINKLFNKYRDNEFIITKLHNYINNILEQNLINMHDNEIERRTKKNFIENEKAMFIHTYLSTKHFYYINNTDIFIMYDSINYTISTEDDIHFDILSSLSNNNRLTSCKHQLKNTILKYIKKKKISEVVPESATIQQVSAIFIPYIFLTKHELKYFLCILGDNILKKNEHLHHFVKPSTKSFLNTLLINMVSFLGHNNPISTFKSKYQDHKYEDCRILSTSDAVKNKHCYESNVKKNILNIICVACHYSERYNNSDNYIFNICTDGEYTEKVGFILNQTQENIVELFVSKYIEILPMDENIGGISWKNMQYLWKMFTKDYEIPNVVYSSNLKQILTSQLQLNYNEHADVFAGITSKHLPLVSLFNSFWEKHISEDDNYDFEIDELPTIFKKWLNAPTYKTMVNDKYIINLVKHYYPNATIENDKYILDIKCDLWNKTGEIIDALKSYRAQTKIPQVISINDIYDYYCKLHNNHYIASKRFFDKYINSRFYEHINGNIIEHIALDNV
jgi:hypothetical protein